MSLVKPITTLQYLALLHEISYANLCKEIGVTPQQFTDWVKKRRPIPSERLEVIAKYFKVKEEQLVEGNNYLYDLTENLKIDFQIAILKQKLSESTVDDERVELKEKIDYLDHEKEKINELNRFKMIYENGSEQSKKLCRAFLNKIEAGNVDQLQSLLDE